DSRDELIHMMEGREVSAIFPERAVPIGDVVLETRALTCRAAGIREITIALRAGEILGVAGLVGSGRTQLAETLFGLTPADGGEIRLRGRPARIESPADAIRLHIGYVPEDRRRHGVVLDMPIASNVSLANLPAVSQRGLIQRGREEALARRYVDRLRIKAASIDDEAACLSGGNQQKVALARWLAIDPA